MSDQSPPPKPKPGSLRDRIAAFENKGSSPQQGPPIPRPKPGAVQWKPRPPSPPSPDNPQLGERKPTSTGTMSTSDAIESIGRGGSLRERMAALQGKGAFGGPPPPIAPKPNVERPKWKPPPSTPASGANDDPNEVVPGIEAAARDASRSPPPRAASSPSPENQETSNREGDSVPHDGDGAAPDPEEDERQRRAAIAARMARLGGARFGMAPPIFAPKPVVRKVDPAASEVKQDLPVESIQVLATPPPHDLPATLSPEPEPYETERKDEHELHASVAPRAPSSMPVPAGPRRAAPPRKRASKPSSALPEPPVEEAEGVTTDEPLLSADRPVHGAPLAIGDLRETAEAAQFIITSDQHSTVDVEHITSKPPTSIEEPEKRDIEDAAYVVEESTHTAAGDQHPLEQSPEVDQPQEEDDETRRQRVAERLAQMGAFNPLAGPPPVPRRTSLNEPAPVRSEEPLDVEDEVNVDTEEYGETIPPPPTDPTRLVEAQPVKDDAPESLETDQDNKLDEDVQTAHRDGEYAVTTSYAKEQPIEHSVTDVVAEQAQGTAFETSHASRQDDVASIEIEPKDVVEHVSEPPPRVAARPTIPPPVNLRSKPTPPSSPPLEPPVKAPLEVLKVDEEPPASPDMPPRPIPPPGRSGSVTEDPPSPPPRRSIPPPPRRTSMRVTEMLAEPSSPPPVPTSSRPVSRRLDTPPIITTIVQEPTLETHEREHGEEETEETTARPEEDEAAMRRRAIAERMARLGGIRFGGPPPMNPLSRPPLPSAPPPTSIPPDELDFEEKEDGEEEEEARKQRIAAKLAGMGGMRLGMLPPGVPARRATKEEGEDEVPVPVPAPHRPTRKPPPPVVFVAEPESQGRESDDGVRVEVEESEVEEVRYSDAEAPLSEDGTERLFQSGEALPTPPPRVSPTGRPPIPTIPTTLLGRRPSGTTTSSRQASLDESSETPHPHSGYVMVEAEGEDAVSPPRRKSTRGSRSIVLPPPPPPPSAVDPPEALSMSMTGAQWELPVIPQGQEGEEVASSGWSEDSTAVHFPAPVSSAPSSRRASSKGVLSTSRSGSVSASGSGFGSGSGLVTSQQQMTMDELVAVSERVGGRVVEATTALYEKSKRALVGDGSYAGFVRAALTQAGVPSPLTGDEWGYVVYAQTGSAVQRRVSDILPGDVIAFWDAKLKGHKGLQPYSQTVGVGESAPLVGIVSELDGKKSKVRVWQANQHVGQQTVEIVSYRLDDLKSGVVKVYRVLDA